MARLLRLNETKSRRIADLEAKVKSDLKLMNDLVVAVEAERKRCKCKL